MQSFVLERVEGNNFKEWVSIIKEFDIASELNDFHTNIDDLFEIVPRFDQNNYGLDQKEQRLTDSFNKFADFFHLIFHNFDLIKNQVIETLANSRQNVD